MIVRLPRRRWHILLVALVAVLGLAAPAHAAWSSSATGTGTAKAATLAPPSDLTATCGGIIGGVLGRVVTLTWPASASASVGTMSYEVLMGTSAGSYTVPGPMTTNLSYETGTLSNGTYYFAVRTAAGANWRSTNSVERIRSISILGCS